MSTCLHVLPGLMGGVCSIVDNLVRHWPEASQMRPRVLLTDARYVTDTRHEGTIGGLEPEWVAHELPRENLYAALARLARGFPTNGGVIFSHDWYELAALMGHSTEASVYQVLHGDIDYYYDLARDYAEAIDAHVTYSRQVFDTLCSRIPERRDRIFWIPYGVDIPDLVRTPSASSSSPLRLLFAGRLSDGQKGVFHLPEIATRLEQAGIECRWSIVGDGPDSEALRARWAERGDASVRWLGALDRSKVLAEMLEHDVFVLPTRFEGFPVALVEAMSCGLVPVVSDIASGVPELVRAQETGFRPAVDDVDGFALAITELANRRDLLSHCSANARRHIADNYDVRDRVGDYVRLCDRARELYRAKPVKRTMPVGSRLDKPWLPNWLVRGIRLARAGAIGPPRRSFNASSKAS